MTGLILLDKSEGISSFGAVAQIRRIFGEKRAGHTGTLDPMATGVLPILLGRSTRLSGLLLDADKRYTATIKLGTATDTCDITGNIIKDGGKLPALSDIESALPGFRGEIMQTPPMYSAIKHNGQRLYDIARSGMEVERQSRLIEIKKLDIIDFSGDLLTVDVLCSKGTYIRSLAYDLGEALGCGATLSALRRTQTGGFSIDQCVTLERLREHPAEHLLDAGECIKYLPAVTVTDNQRARYLHGGELFINRIISDSPLDQGQLCRVYDRDGILLGVSVAQGEFIKVKCIIFEGEQ